MKLLRKPAGSIIKVVGVDAAFANMGFARFDLDLTDLSLKIESATTLTTEKLKQTRKVIRQNSDDMRRAVELYQGFHKQMEGCTYAFAEIPSGTQMARAAMGFGIAIGVLASCPIPLFQVMPSETKEATGLGKKADKPEIIAWAADLYPQVEWQRYEKDSSRGKVVRTAGDLHDDNEHVADSCAIVHAGLRTPEFKAVLPMLRAAANIAA
jgi:hypothetical protein